MTWKIAEQQIDKKASCRWIEPLIAGVDDRIEPL
jgi:hypothetical protein